MSEVARLGCCVFATLTFQIGPDSLFVVFMSHPWKVEINGTAHS